MDIIKYIKHQRVLFLPIKKKWFDMILSGEKKTEYREINKHWASRLLANEIKGDVRSLKPKDMIFKSYDVVCFINGYKKAAPRIYAKLEGIGSGRGKKSWGAPNKSIFKIHIGDIFHVTPEELLRETLRSTYMELFQRIDTVSGVDLKNGNQILISPIDGGFSLAFRNYNITKEVAENNQMVQQMWDADENCLTTEIGISYDAFLGIKDLVLEIIRKNIINNTKGLLPIEEIHKPEVKK